MLTLVPSVGRRSRYIHSDQAAAITKARLERGGVSSWTTTRSAAPEERERYHYQTLTAVNTQTPKNIPAQHAIAWAEALTM